MPSSITFLCQNCLMTQEGRYLRKYPNPLSDIAFSMPDPIFETIRKKLAAIDNEAAKTIRETDEFRCLSMEEVKKYTEKHDASDDAIEYIRGTLKLDWKWLKDRLKTLRIETDPRVADQSGMVYEGIHEFWFNQASDGTQIPWLIKDAEHNVIGRELRCRNCGRFLPVDTGKAPELCILLQGNSRAGKTSVIVATLWWLNVVALIENSGIGYEPTREQDAVSGGVAAGLNEYHRWIRTELERFNNGHKVEKTPSQQNAPGSVSVLVTIGEQPLVLTFVDMPGELFEGSSRDDGKLLDQYTHIYRNADAIWTCLQYEVLVDKDWSAERAKIMDDTGLERKNLELDRALYTAQLKELIRFLSPGQSVPEQGANRNYRRSLKDKPHAVILTKTDSLAGRLPQLERSYIFKEDTEVDENNLQEGMAISQPDENGKRYPMLKEEEFYKISSGVYRFCKQNVGMDALGMLRVLERMTDNTCFCANSAYGHPALKKGDTNVKAPHPYHVQLPLLWTLAVCDKLQIYYEVQEQGWLWFGHTRKPESHFISEADSACVNHLLKNPSVYTPHVRRRKE